MKKNIESILLVILFIIVYAFFVVRVHTEVTDYSDIIVGTTFFFTLFIGYFITRQNDRYSSISDNLTSSDGWMSYLYRITGLVPRIQSEIRGIVRSHYEKIIESKDLAYHVRHPSDT